jgi:CBS domain-containing protein
MDHYTFQQEAELHFGTVRQAMTARVLALEAEMRASDAALRLGVEGVAGGPVVEGGRVVGVITLRDLLEREGHVSAQTTGPFLRGERHLANLTVADVMTRDVMTALAEWPLTRALGVMEEAGVNRLPVVDDEDRPVGILAREDVLHAIARALREPTSEHPGAPRIEPD